jgi:transposase
MSKIEKRTRITELTPEVLVTLNQDTLVSVIMRLYEQNIQLSEQLRNIIVEKYGRKTEKFLDPNQLRFFSAVDNAEQESQPQPLGKYIDGAGTIESKPIRKAGHARNTMPPHLPRVPIRGKVPPEDTLICKCCAIVRVKVNEVVSNSRLEFEPANLHVEEFVNMIFACPSCGDSIVVEPEVPESIINGTAGPGLQTEIAINKYADASPLYRQEQKFARLGVSISRSTMCGWLASTVTTARPIYELMRLGLLKSLAIATDDTPVKVQDRKKKQNIKTGRFWIYRGDNNQPFNVFDYTEGHARAGPKTFLGDWKGYLQGDCFSGNQALCTETGAVHVACHAHARRYFIKAEPYNKAACAEILQLFKTLFDIERDARELALSSADVKLIREQEAKPILASMKLWLDAQVLIALPRSSFGKAVKYCLNNWQELNNYLLDSELRIDNNLAEQEMKTVAIGRKNWLFLGSDNGGERAEVLLSIVSTCKRHQVNPWNYLYDIIKRLTEDPNQDLEQLLPNKWKAKYLPTVSAEIDGVKPTPKVVFA